MFIAKDVSIKVGDTVRQKKTSSLFFIYLKRLYFTVNDFNFILFVHNNLFYVKVCQLNLLNLWKLLKKEDTSNDILLVFS